MVHPALLRNSLGLIPSLLIVVALLLAIWSPFGSRVYAAQLSPRSMIMSNATAGAVNVSYELVSRIATDGLVGSIVVEFCSNSPLESIPCTAPNGFDASGVTLTNQSGLTGFVVSTFSTANTSILTRPPANATAGTNTDHAFGGIVNQSSSGPLFVRVFIYPTSDASGPYTDSGGMALMINDAIIVNAEVPPYIVFCLGESIVNFDCNTATEAFSDLGDLNSLLTSAAQNQIVIATNADNGYTMWVMGTTMTSGNNVLPAMTGAAAQPGTPQFGMNLRANTVPTVGQDPAGPGSAGIEPGYDQPNQFRFQGGDPIASAPAPDDFRKYTVSYVVNIANNQPGGVYSTTLTYVCLGNF